MPLDRSPVWAALGPLGIAHRAQLREQRASATLLTQMLADGTLRRVRRDWFVSQECHPLVMRAAFAGATLGCVSAAVVHDLWDVRPTHIHLSAAANTPRIDHSPPKFMLRREPLVVHRTSRPEPPIAPRARAPIQSVPNVLLSIAHCQPVENAVIVLDSALRRGKIHVAELQVLAESDAAIRAVLAQSHPKSDSDAETVARMRLAARGITMIPQVVIDGHPVDGLIGQRLVLQLDGFGPHSARERRNNDLKQDDRLRRMGYVVLRFSRDQVFHEWPMIISSILSICAAGKQNW